MGDAGEVWAMLQLKTKRQRLKIIDHVVEI